MQDLQRYLQGKSSEELYEWALANPENVARVCHALRRAVEVVNRVKMETQHGTVLTTDTIMLARAALKEIGGGSEVKG